MSTTPRSFAGLIAERSGDSGAVVRFGAHTGTWRDLLTAAERSAEWLTACGVRPGDVVGLLADAELGTVATVLGAWQTGATVTVLAAPSSAKRLRDDYASWVHERLAQLDVALLAGGVDPGIRWPATQPGPLGMQARRNPSAPDRCAEPPLILQLTSGSTGTPKVVPVTADAALANVTATAQRLELSTADSVVSWLPLNHDMGLIGTFILPALYGMGLRLSTPDTFVRGPMSWLRALSESRATLTFAPHFAYALVARYGAARPAAGDVDLSTLRHCMNGSEPVDGAEFAAFGEFAAGCGLPDRALRPGYGMAELGLVFSLAGPGAPVRTVTADPDSLVLGGQVRTADSGSTVVGCGPPLDGYAATVRNTAGELLPDRTVGEICVSGPSLFAGYRGRPRARHFWPDGAYRTGDLGFLYDGEIFVCGRVKDVIIVRGENIVPHELERSVAELDGVRAGNVAAFGVPTRDGEAVVVAAEAADPSAELRARITERVRARTNVRPADVVLLAGGKLPKTTSGKLQRQLTKRTYLEGAWDR